MYQTSCCFIDYLSIENWHTIILYCRLMDCLPFEPQPTHTECITDGVSSHFECPEEFSFMRTTTEAFWVCGQVCVALIAFSSCTVTEWVTYISLLSIGVSVSWLHSDSSSWTRGFNKGPVPTDSLHRALKRKKKKVIDYRRTATESTECPPHLSLSIDWILLTVEYEKVAPQRILNGLL